jgi:hypothetical protein
MGNRGTENGEKEDGGRKTEERRKGHKFQNGKLVKRMEETGDRKREKGERNTDGTQILQSSIFNLQFFAL